MRPKLLDLYDVYFALSHRLYEQKASCDTASMLCIRSNKMTVSKVYIQSSGWIPQLCKLMLLSGAMFMNCKMTI